MIERRQGSQHDTDEALSDMADDATRAGAIIQRLRALLRRGEPSLSAVDVNRLLADVEPIVAAELREFEVALELELSQGLPPVKGDAVQLQQVLLNLLSNACHAMSTLAREQRKLIIRTWRALDPLEEDMVLLDVCDAGPPVAADVFERIFEPFFTTKSTGLGMGLAITRSIIAAHHGRVWATRNATRGITVHVTLPVCR
jgi:C4-dicarboxylate-specific signal transduction histidine kinase